MSDWIGQGLGVAARIMRGEGKAAALIDASRAGVQASFLGLALAIAMDAGIVSSGLLDATEQVASGQAVGGQAAGGQVADGQAGGAAAPPSRFGAFLSLALMGVVTYAAAIAAVLVLTRAPEHRARFPAYLAAQNWTEAVLGALLLVPKWLLFSLPTVRVEGAVVTGSPVLSGLLVIGIAVVTFVVHYRVVLHALGVSGVRAFWMVVAAYAASFMAAAVVS